MPTTRNRWQQEIQPSPEQATADDQANQANPERKRQSSPQRPSVSPAPELAADLQDDPNPRSPKRRRISLDGANESKPDTSQASTTHDPSPSTMDSGQQAVTNSQTPQPLHAKPTVMSSTPTQAPSNGPQPSSAQQTQRPLHQEPLGTTATKIPSMATNTPHPPPRATGPPSQAALQHLPVPQTATSASTLTASPTATGPPAAPSLTTPAASKAPALPAPPAAPPPAGAAPMPRGPPAPPTEVIKGRLDNLQKLGDLSEQVLILLSKMPVLDALALDADLRLLSSGQQPSSPAPAEYQRLRALFDPVRNLYVTGFPFLIAEHLAMREPSQTAIIRKANQAMFCSAIFAGGIGQLALDQAFLDIFVPDNGNLFGAQSNIWLELKTQGFMTAMRLKAAPPNQVMSDLFPAGIESRIIARHPASKTLAPSEHEFAARYEGRRKILFDHISRNALPDLDQKFTYVELAKEVANFLIRTYGVGSGPPSLADPIGAAAQGISQSQEGNVPAPVASAAGVSAPQLPASIGSLPSFDATDFIELAARAAAIAMRGTASPAPTPAVAVTRPPPNPQAEAQPQNQVQSGVQPSPNAQNGPPSEPYIPLEPNNSIPHASQSAPTHVLYQRARAAEPMKSSTPGTPRTDADASLRRTWSEEEEKALMDGLDRVQGPHWANIMALHGPGGSLSDALKERNQVQLKDKARNLKLFFLKNKIEVPYYLSQVTGTLETRAPGQADKLDSDPTEHNFKELGTEEVQDYKAQDVGHDQSEPMEDIKFDNEVKQLHQPNAVMSSIGIDDTKMVVPEAGTEAPNPA